MFSRQVVTAKAIPAGEGVGSGVFEVTPKDFSELFDNECLGWITES